MPMRSAIDPDRSLVVTLVEGVVTDADIRELRRELPGDPGFDRSFDHFVDMTGVDRVDVSLDVRIEVVERSIFGGGSRRAIVAPATPWLGFARQHALLRTGGAVPENVRVFTSRGEAETWLGLD